MASPARFDPARFWSDYTGRAGLARKGETGYTFEPGPQAGGLAGWPAGFFPYVTFSVQNHISTKTTLQYII